MKARERARSLLETIGLGERLEFPWLEDGAFKALQALARDPVCGMPSRSRADERG